MILQIPLQDTVCVFSPFQVFILNSENLNMCYGNV